MSLRRSMMLVEAARLRALILEAREDGLAKRFVPIIVKNMPALAVQIPGVHVTLMAYDKMSQKDAERLYGDIIPDDPGEAGRRAKTAVAIIMWCLACDPSDRNIFTTWMVGQFCKGLFNLEDMPRVADALIIYMEAKKGNHIPRSHDLGTVKTLDDLYALVAPFKAQGRNKVVDTRYEASMYQQSIVAVNTDKYLIVIPKSQEAAQWFGRDSEWCTAWGSPHGDHKDRNCMYASYATRGPLFIITRKSDEVMWQFQRESRSYMDANDSQINVPAFVQENPEVANFFVQRDLAMGKKVGSITSPDGKALDIYDDGDGHMFSRRGIGLGAETTDFSIDYDEDNTIRGFQFGELAYREDDTTVEIIEFLNSRDLNGPNDNLILADILYDETAGRYGRLRDIAPRVWSNDKFEWKKVGADYRLYSVDETNDTVFARTRSRTRDPDPHSLVVVFDNNLYNRHRPKINIFKEFVALLEIKNDPLVDFDEDSSRFNPLYYFPDAEEDSYHTEKAPAKGSPYVEMYRNTVKRFPGAVTLRRDWDVNGDSKRFRQRLVPVIHNTIPDHAPSDKIVYTKDSYSMFLFKDLADAVGTVGDYTTQYVWRVLEGDDGQRHHSDEADESQRIDLLKTLAPEQRVQVATKLLAEADVIDLEEYEDHDWTEPTDIIDLFDAIGASELSGIFNSAVTEGSRVGRENEITTAFQKAVTNSGLRFYEEATKKYSSEAFMWDTKCAWFVKVADIMEELDENADEANINGSYDFKSLRELKMHEPSYGYHGYDEGAAKERFLEDLNDAGYVAS